MNPNIGVIPHFIFSFLFLTIVIYPEVTYAYIGPGLGAGTIGVIIGILVSVLLAIFAIFWYPIKRLFKKNKKTDIDSANENE
jgi:hypothetical protein